MQVVVDVLLVSIEVVHVLVHVVLMDVSNVVLHVDVHVKLV